MSSPTDRRSRPRFASTLRLIVALVAAAVLAGPGPAAADVFTVKVVGGGSFDTRYQPEEASWDTDQVLLLTELGNWIAVPKADIESIESQTENKGYGRVIDTTTISLGFKINDAPVEEEGGQGSALDRLLEYMVARDRGAEQDYSVEQFVEPGLAGTGGLPTYGLQPPSGSTVDVFGGVPPQTSFPRAEGGVTPVEPSPIN